MKGLATLATLAMLVPAPQVAAQSGGLPSQSPAKFGASVNVVEVDVTVTDTRGRSVTDLTSADFDITEEGKPQKIQALYLVTADPAVLQSAPPGTPGADEVLVPARRQLAQRVFVFAFDLLHLSPDGLMRARRAVEAFLTGETLPGDIFGLVADGRMANNHLTSDKAEVLRGLNEVVKPNSSRFVWQRQYPRILDDFEASQIAKGDEETLRRAIARACSDREDECRFAREVVIEKARRVSVEGQRDSLASLQTLNALTSGLGRLPGVKQLVLFSEGYFIDQAADRLTQIVGLAARANVRISALDARGLGRDPGQPADVHTDVLTALAIDTGGVLATNQNNLAPALDRVSQEASTYYVLGYAPTKPLDGSFRAIRVSVRRPAVIVRARRGYVATVAAGQSSGQRLEPAGDPIAVTVRPAAVAPPAVDQTSRPEGQVARSTTGSMAARLPDSSAARSADAAPPYRFRPDSSDHIAALASRGATADVGNTSEAAARADRLAREGWDFYSKGDVEHARDRLAEAVTTNLARPWVSYALGHAEFALSHAEAAAWAWENVRRQLPEYEPVYFDLAAGYLSLKRLSDALVVLREATRLWPNDPEGHNALGVALVRRNSLDDAVEEFQKATSVAPGDGLGYFNLGRAYQLRYARLQQNASKTSLEGMHTLGDGDRQRAIDVFTRYLQIGGPFERDARDAIAMLAWK